MNLKEIVNQEYVFSSLKLRGIFEERRGFNIF